MDGLVLAVIAAAVIAGVTTLAPRLGVAAPLLLVLLGFGVSLLPFVTVPQIEPELILTGVLPPLLYSSAVAMPAMEFRRDFAAIGGLSVTLVVVTTTVLGFVIAAVVPGISLATGFALGAIVSPTDAVATSIVKRLGVSPRVVTVLEGESLLNDASALVLLRSAVAATAASVSLWHVAGDFVRSVLIAVVVGVVVGRLNLVLRRRVADAAVSTTISFVAPFVAFLPAEHLGASGLVAAVAAGLVTGQGAPRYLEPRHRLAETSNWRTVELLLEGGVFLLMGLELKAIVSEVLDTSGDLALALGLGALVAAIVVVIRALYVWPLLRGLTRRQLRGVALRDQLVVMQRRLDAGQLPARPRQTGRGPDPLPSADSVPFAPSLPAAASAPAAATPPGADSVPAADDPPTGDTLPTRDSPAAGEQPAPAMPPRRVDRWAARVRRTIADVDYLAGAPLGPKEGAVLVWAGMRGVVTLAAAQTLPHDTPRRALLVLVAFVVAAGTLLVQGGTLPWLVRRLGLAGGDAMPDADERRRLIRELSAAGTALLDDPALARPDGTPYGERVVGRVRRETWFPEDDEQVDATRERGAQYLELRLRVIEAMRTALLQARSDGTYASETLEGALAVLDADQIGLELKGD
jgi:monovalent cation/hydrogen antiporter